MNEWPNFWVRVEKTPGCWLWKGARGSCGYGNIQPWGRNGPTFRAHRFAYELLVGLIPKGLLVLHKCDNPACVNPAHLFLGTQADNLRDMDSKGRRVVVRGERNGHAKLRQEQVEEIRTGYASGTITQKELASQYGIDISTVSLIVRGKRWAS